MADNPTFTMRAACECGTCVVETTRPPKSRLNCHCTICQAFTGEAFSDVMIIPAHRAVIKNEEWLTFKRYKKYRLPPPNLSRGRCKKCAKPFIETWGPGAMKLLFVRAVWFDRQDALVPPEGHLFYEHRVKDIDDGIPKHYGYFDSEWATGLMIVHAI